MTWTPDAPRFPLLDGPSPLQPLPRFAAALGDGLDLWIKREDLLPLAFGGNKLRNLEFLVGAALAEGADALVTAGRGWSNHCRLTAAAGARAGLEVHLVLSGPPPDKPGANAQLEALLGAHVHQAATGDRAEREATVDRVTADLRASGRRPYVIAVGGSGVTGAIGQVLAGLELADQARERGVVPDVVVVPSATGGTQAGLITGLRLAGLATIVLGVACAHPVAVLRPAVETLLVGLGTLTGADVDPSEDIVIDESELGSGYGRPSPASADALELLARTEGILVDPIYTAKALAALIAQVRDGRLAGRTAVFWHAGGTPGLFEILPD